MYNSGFILGDRLKIGEKMNSYNNPSEKHMLPWIWQKVWRGRSISKKEFSERNQAE